MSTKELKNLGAAAAQAFTIDPIKLWVAGYDYDAKDGSNFVEIDKGRFAIDKALVKNIAAVGVIQAVQARLVNGELIVVNGRRRVLHARAANELRKEQGQQPLPIKFTLEAGGDDASAQVTMVAANHFHAEHGPMSQARKAQAMLNASIPEADVANAFGFSKATLGNRLKLLTLPRQVQTLVEKGSLGFMPALEFADALKSEEMDADAVVAAAEKLVASEGGRGKGSTRNAKNSRGKSEDDGEHKPPARGKLEKMLATEEFSACSDEVQRTIRWVVGALKTPNTIEGLAAAWKAATKKKAPPRAEAAE